jgi:hypothetical protein
MTAGTAFGHVANIMLRRVLEQEPRHIRRTDMQQAVRWTVEALGRDAINPEVPEDAFDTRRDAAREADKAITKHQHSRAHAALRKYWNT